jgi:hypothetical protein
MWINQTAAEAGLAAASHTHAISEIINLPENLSGKADATHTHAISDVTNLQTSLNGKLSATITSPATGQTIQYNGTTWVNAAAAATGETISSFLLMGA